MGSLFKKILKVVVVFILSSFIIIVAVGRGYVPQASNTNYTFQFVSNESGANGHGKAGKLSYPHGVYKEINDDTKFNVASSGLDAIVGNGAGQMPLYYMGEVPYKETHKEDGNARVPFHNYPYNRVVVDTDSASLYDHIYWGNLDIAANKTEINMADLEKVDTTKSVRLHALENTARVTGFAALTVLLSIIVVSIISVPAVLATLFIILIVNIKSINVIDIFKALHLDFIVDIVGKVFIYTKDSSGNMTMSPFSIFCIISFMIAVASFIYRYLKGAKKTKDIFKDILLLGLVGIIVTQIGMSTKNALTVGEGAAKLTDAVIQIAATSGNNVDECFITSTTGTESYKNLDLLATEISFINKIMIDVNLCTQFNVANVSKLDMAYLGDTDYSIAEQHLLKYKDRPVSIIEDLKDVGYNIGYYFYFANSANETLHSNRAKLSKVANTQQEKLTQLVTYMQALLQKAIENDDVAKQEEILSLIRGLALPNYSIMIYMYLFLIVLFVLLALTLFTYAFNALKSKLTLLLAVVAMPVAGMLIFSAKQNLVKTGKGLLGLFVSSFINVAVYSLIFDTILLVVVKLITTNLLGMVILTVFIFIIWRLNPYIAEQVQKFLASTERAYSPASVTLKNNTKAYLRRKITSTRSKIAEKDGKVVGYDENGKEIREKSKGKLLNMALDVAESALTDSANSKKSGFHIFRKNRQAQADEQANTYGKIRDAANRIRFNRYNTAQNEFVKLTSQMQSEIIENRDSVIDSTTGQFNINNMTDFELDLYNKYMNLYEHNKLYNLDLNKNHEYLSLLAKFNDNPNAMSDADKNKLKKYRDTVNENETKTAQAKQLLTNAIDGRISGTAHSKYDDKIKASLLEMQDANNNIIAEGGASVVQTRNGKIKENSTLSKDAFENKMIIAQNLANLAAGKNLINSLDQDDKEKAEQEYKKYMADNNLEKIGSGRDKEFEAVNEALAKINKEVTDKNVEKLAEERAALRRSKHEPDAPIEQPMVQIDTNTEAQIEHRNVDTTNNSEKIDVATQQDSSNNTNIDTSQTTQQSSSTNTTSTTNNATATNTTSTTNTTTTTQSQQTQQDVQSSNSTNTSTNSKQTDESTKDTSKNSSATKAQYQFTKDLKNSETVIEGIKEEVKVDVSADDIADNLITASEELVIKNTLDALDKLDMLEQDDIFKQ